MVKFISVLVTALMFSFSAQAAEPVGILVVGDSWAWLSCQFGSFDAELKHQGYKSENAEVRAKIYGCNQTTEGGLKSYHLVEEKYQYKIREQLLKHEDVKIVYISAGGNDFSKYWNKQNTEAEETAIFEKIRSHLQNVSDFILSVRPDVKILITGYDYPNFKDFIQIKPYKEKFENMGRPSVLELNSALLRMAAYLSTRLNNSAGNINYIHHYGLMHYYYGQKKYGLEKKQTAHPSLISSPDSPESFGGDISMETPPEGCMRVTKKYLDAFHLSPNGFQKAFRHSIYMYLAEWLEEFSR
ncbi:MAG: hypothetical protein KDD38_06645 [Bdellovibrionales bacterium]|nr:hypothetical protein [Bdellovibrionales bacterium]